MYGFAAQMFNFSNAAQASKECRITMDKTTYRGTVETKFTLKNHMFPYPPFWDYKVQSDRIWNLLYTSESEKNIYTGEGGSTVMHDTLQFREPGTYVVRVEDTTISFEDMKTAEAAGRSAERTSRTAELTFIIE